MGSDVGQMLEQLVGALERHPGVHDWTVRARRRRSVQVYLLPDGLENVREVTSESFSVSVFNDHSGPAGERNRPTGAQQMLARGVANLTLVPADRDRVAERVEDGVVMAQLVHNPPYALPEPSHYPDVPLADPELSTAAGRTAATRSFTEEVRQRIGAERGVCLSAAELFLTFEETTLRTSRGVAVESAETHVLAELALLAGDPTKPMEEAEFFQPLEARRFADLRLEQTIAQTATYARDTLSAQTPRSRIGPVVLSGEALAPLFDAYTFQASGSAAYQKIARMEPGQSVYGDRAPSGDKLTLRVNALRPFGYASHRVDGDGVPGQAALLIEDGILRARHSTQRYAQYLGVPATGAAGNTEVLAGLATLQDLLTPADGPLYHVVMFSYPDVDPITGDFGWEIRLGYEITSTGARPIKGGSVSGNLFEGFTDVRFSRDTLELRDYAGPLAARFASLSVSGD